MLNTWEFWEYHQIMGTAMGTIVAPTYSTLVIGYLEIEFYQKCKQSLI